MNLVGGQETMSKFIDYKMLSKSVGYSDYKLCKSFEEIEAAAC